MPETVQADGNMTIADFQTVVQQQEGIFGPLTALGKQGSNNTITFDIGSAPANRTVLATYEGDAPPARDGHSVVCKGDCLVAGQPAKVVAYRQN